MKIETILVTLLLISMLSYSQATTAIKPYPDQETEQKVITQPPLIPPIVWTGIMVIVGIFVVLGMFGGFILVILLLIKFMFPPKPIPEFEKLKQERISSAKHWNGSSLDTVRLIGDSNVPPSTIGYCTGFKAEQTFDYITYHHGTPAFLFILRMLKGPKFQLHIPILNITIPEDHIIQLEPSKHSVPGREVLIYASGVSQAQSKYEVPNTSDIAIHKRMEMERAEIIARTHGKTASHVAEISEKMWESTKEHFKKRDNEPSKSPAGR